MKKITSILTGIIILLCFNSMVFADSVLDLTRKGSIQITMKYEGNYISGGNLTIYKIANVDVTNGEYNFVLTDSFANSGKSLENIQSSELASSFYTYAKQNSIFGITKEIDDNGNVNFSDLDLGLYLLVQEKGANGYNKVSPFMVSVPIQENGEYVYNVDASPKIELEKTKEPSDMPDNPKNDTPENSSDLPQTGQLNWPIPVLVVSGIVIFIIGWWIKFGRKKDQYEK